MKGRLHRITEDISGHPRWPLFLRALKEELLWEVEESLRKHAEFNDLFPEREDA